MRFKFAAGEAISKGLRVLPEIPDLRLSRLEGRNGIGKTLAARLLELVSGQEPFAAIPRAWGSLVELLGRVEITIDEIPEGVIRISLDSSAWLGKTQSQCAADPGSATLNDNPIAWSDLRKIIQIRRIAGDEGLAETLGRTLRERAIEADVERRRVSGIVDSWSHRLEALRDLCGGIDSGDLARLRAARDNLVDNRRGLETRLDSAKRNLSALNLTAEMMQRLFRGLDEVSALISHYRETWDDRASIDAKIVELEAALSDAGAQDVVAYSDRLEARSWAKKLRLRQNALARAQVYERRLLASLSFEDRPETGRVLRELKELAAQVGRLKEELRTADLAGTIRAVGHSLQEALEEVPPQARDQAVADLDRPISAEQLISAVERRRRRLEGIPRPGEAARISLEIETLELRSRRLQALDGTFDTTDRKRGNVDEALTRLSQLEENAGNASTKVEVQRSLNDLRGALLNRTVEVSSTFSEIAALTFGVRDDGTVPSTLAGNEQPLGSFEFSSIDGDVEGADEDPDGTADGSAAPLPEPDQLSEMLAAWADELRGTLGDRGQSGRLGARLSPPTSTARLEASQELAAEIAAAELALADLLRSEQLQEEEEATAESSLIAARTTVASAVRVLMSDSSDWRELASVFAVRLRSAQVADAELELSGDGYLGLGLPQERRNEVEHIAASELARIVRLGESVEEQASAARDAWATVVAYLNAQTIRLAPRLADPGANGANASAIYGAVGDLLANWVELEIGEVINSPSLREQIFGGASSVAFDLEGLAVHWRTPNGERRRRPLEAFSSGEQVFAYTRAKLETFRELKAAAAHVVVFLDEFGAFVARDRFGELMRYVHDEVIGEIADQVVVLLPASSMDILDGQDPHCRFRGEGYVVLASEAELVR